MTLSKLTRYGLISPLLAALISCASGSGGGITGSGIVIGPITGLGSIIVNGVTFDVDNANVTVNGTPADTSALKLGMVVEVRGTIDAGTATGVASSVAFDTDLRGPVEAVDVSQSTIVVLGQLVIATPTTIFDGTTLDTLAVGQYIEVSGFVDGEGNVRATRVELESDDEISEIEGLTADLDAEGETFRIGGQLVDYSGAEIKNAPAGGLQNGLFVEVHAHTAATGGTLVADEVEVKGSDFGGDEGEDVEIEGFVTRMISATEFVLNQTSTVRITAQTEFDGGSAADIAVDVRVEVEGVVDGTGVLVAREIGFR